MKQRPRAIGRPRPRKIIARASIFLLLGAIVNIAVAWAFVCWTRPSFSDIQFSQESSWGAPVPAEWPTTTYHRRLEYVGLSEWIIHGEWPQEPEHSWRAGTTQSIVQAGWPCRAMALERHRVEHPTERWGRILRNEPPIGWQDGLSISRVIPWRAPSNYENLPTLPTWPGFAINTLFYAAILWLLFAAVFELRRKRRIQRGLCPACAYPVGTSPVCTECGKPIPSPLRG